MPNDRHQQIYAHDASGYERLIEREDADGNLRACLERLLGDGEIDLLDVGAGTGRIARMLHRRARKLVLTDGSAAMLAEAERLLRAAGRDDARFVVADNASLPVPDASFDAAIAAWSFGHATRWFPDDWQARIASYVDELVRAVKPGGHAVIIETLGTGAEHPAPPRASLAAYYEYLEAERGFVRETIRTDFVFASIEEGVELAAFFGWDALAEQLRATGTCRAPEWTGVWHREC
jgi:ubiquinone/menaquinone biosynthesis C-methylase UbiE